MNIENRTDEELVDRVKSGDILAYEQIVKRYEKKLSKFLRRWTDEESLIEETIQDALFKLYKNIHRVDGTKNFSAYVYTMAKNQLMDRFRKEKKTLPLSDWVIGTSDEDLYEKMERDRKKGLVRRLLQRLNKQHRKVIRLYFFEELSYKRIGQVMGLPLNTIKTNLRRAKAGLLKLLKNEKK